MNVPLMRHGVRGLCVSVENDSEGDVLVPGTADEKPTVRPRELWMRFRFVILVALSVLVVVIAISLVFVTRTRPRTNYARRPASMGNKL